MSFLRKLKKILKNAGVEKDVIADVLDEAEEVLEIEKELDPEPKPKDEPVKKEDVVPEGYVTKEEHEAEVAKVKLDAQVDVALSGANIKDGYKDIVKGLLDLSDLKDGDDVQVVLKGKLEQIGKDRGALFNEAPQLKLKGAEPGDPDKKPDGIDFKTASYEEIATHLNNGGDLPK